MKPIYLKPDQSLLFVPAPQIGIAPGIGPVCRHGSDDVKKWVCCAPFHPGEVCYVPEVWGVGSRPHPYEGCVDGIEYKADEQYFDEHDDLPLYQIKTPDGVDLCDYASGWKPPVTMPRWASRRFVTVLSCEPMKVSEVTEEDCIAMGFTDTESAQFGPAGGPYENMGARIDFYEYWQSRHPGKEWVWRIEVKENKRG